MGRYTMHTAAAALKADPEIGAIQLIEPEVNPTQPGRVVAQCPGCAEAILTPRFADAGDWTERPFWCVPCGGTAATVLDPTEVRAVLDAYADAQRDLDNASYEPSLRNGGPQ